jgi:uncharacterized protein YndB with AHSA1/START domain
MTIAPIVIRIDSPASPATAWRAITDPAWVTRWFTDATPIGPPGETYHLDFGGGSVVEGEIEVVDPGRTFRHRWDWVDGAPGGGTVVTWTIESLDDDGARVTLRHDGWAEAGQPEEVRDDHASYWEGYLADLEDLLANEA